MTEEEEMAERKRLDKIARTLGLRGLEDITVESNEGAPDGYGWGAWVGDFEPASKVGTGRTPEAAIEDLLDQMEEVVKMNEWKLWKLWELEPPPGDLEVEYRRGKDGPVERILPSHRHPLWNIADVYWRSPDTPPPDNLAEIHATLQRACDILLALRGRFVGVSVDTVFALGEATGTIAKAKALVGRDIDDRKGKGK